MHEEYQENEIRIHLSIYPSIDLGRIASIQKQVKYKDDGLTGLVLRLEWRRHFLLPMMQHHSYHSWFIYIYMNGLSIIWLLLPMVVVVVVVVVVGCDVM